MRVLVMTQQGRFSKFVKERKLKASTTNKNEASSSDTNKEELVNSLREGNSKLLQQLK